MLTTSFPQNSLKTRILIAIIGLIAVGAWSLSYFISRMLHESMQNQLGEQQRSTVAYVATQIDKEFAARLRTLELIAGSLDSKKLEQHEVVQHEIDRQSVGQRLFNAGIWATDRNGTGIADSIQEPSRIGINYADREYFRRTVNGNRSTISGPMIGRVHQRMIIVFSVPVRNQSGKVIGMLCGGSLLDQPSFLDAITQNRYGKTGGFLLVSPAERLIITATDSDRRLERLPPPGMHDGIDRAMNGFRGTEILINARGVESLISTQDIPSTEWYVAASLPTAEAFAPIREMRRNIYIATLILILFSGGVVWWVLRIELLPLETSARILGDMRTQKRISASLPVTRADEIGTLIGAFNELLATLRTRERSLMESEARFKALHNASFGGIAIHDAGIIVDCNQGLVDMTGFAMEELVGMNGLKLIAPDWRDVVWKNMAQFALSSDRLIS